ncbi:AaceriAFR466Cp [[Ashbya] aceris (nom. inval.)]|nr:AaceriAFR466Cp [[Ashbya] aceris (nom. inval.)]
MSKALIVVDVQNDFADACGALAVPGAHEIVRPLAELAQEPGWAYVALTRDWHPPDHVSFAPNHGQLPFSSHTYHPPAGVRAPPQQGTLWPVHCVQGSWGAQLAPQLAAASIRAPHSVVDKGVWPDRECYSAFEDIWDDRRSDLDALLRSHGVEHVYVAGLALDYCVKSTAISAARLGYTTTILLDYTRAIATDAQSMARLSSDLAGHQVSLFEGAEPLP